MYTKLNHDELVEVERKVKGMLKESPPILYPESIEAGHYGYYYNEATSNKHARLFARKREGEFVQAFESPFELSQGRGFDVNDPEIRKYYHIIGKLENFEGEFNDEE